MASGGGVGGPLGGGGPRADDDTASASVDPLDEILEDYSFICEPEVRLKLKQEWVAVMDPPRDPALRAAGAWRACSGTPVVLPRHTRPPEIKAPDHRRLCYARRLRQMSVGLTLAKPWDKGTRVRVTVRARSRTLHSI